MPGQAVDDDLYDESYYSFRTPKRGSRLGALRRLPARLRDRNEGFGGGGIGALLRRIAPNPLVGRLRPLTDGSLGASLSRDATVLDIGCGGGGWLRMLAGAGFTRLTGADPYLSATIESGPIRILNAEVEEVEGRFDLVACSHALEHMADPETALRSMAALLSDEGWLLISIPLSGSYGWRRYGGEWVQLDAPRHAHLYSARGFKTLAARAGLDLRLTVFDSTAFMVLGSEARLAGAGPHQRLAGGGDVKWVMNGMDARTARHIAIVANAAGAGDQATFYFRRQAKPVKDTAAPA